MNRPKSFGNQMGRHMAQCVALIILFPLLVFLLGTVNCGGSRTAPQLAPVLQSIQVSPANVSVALCTGQQFTATGVFSNGTQQDLTRSVSWTSSVASVATIIDSGLARSQSQGSTIIRATLGTTRSGSASLVVGPPALTSIVVVPLNPSIRNGAVQQFISMGACIDGSILNVTRVVAWSSSSSSVATITSSGLASSLGPGNVMITAASGTISGSAELVVTPEVASRFVYVSNQGFHGAGDVSGYSTDRTSGVLTPIPGSPFPADRLPASIAVDPTGRFAYVANSGSFNISGYVINSVTGGLTFMSFFPAGFGPNSVAIDPTGRFVYVANYGLDFAGTVSGYSIDRTTGALTPVPGSPFPAGSSSSSIAIDGSGRFAYVANTRSGDISAFIISASGALTPMPSSPFPTAGNPFSLTLDPTGQFLYVSNRYSGCEVCIRAYLINGGSGSLTEIQGSPFVVGGPSHLGYGTVDPTARFAYFTTTGTFLARGYILGFSINGATGALVGVPGSPFSDLPTMPLFVAVDPTGHFAYITNGTTNPGTVSGFFIDGDTGALNAMPGSPFPAGYGPTSVAIASPR